MGYSVKYLSCVKVMLILFNLLLFVSITYMVERFSFFLVCTSERAKASSDVEIRRDS